MCVWYVECVGVCGMRSVGGMWSVWYVMCVGVYVCGCGVCVWCYDTYFVLYHQEWIGTGFPRVLQGNRESSFSGIGQIKYDREGTPLTS